MKARGILEWCQSSASMVRRYMPTYRKSKKLGSRKLGESSLEVRGEDNGRSGDRIPTSQWKEENTSRCQRLEHYWT